MIKIILTKGAPASGKSAWAKAEVAKDPDNWVRINNDDLRAMANQSVYSTEYEKLILDTRNFMLREALKRNKSVIIDNCNANKQHFEMACKIAQEINMDITVMEQPFYEELEVLLERDAKRIGKEQVGEAVIRKFWKALGGKQHKTYKARCEIFNKRAIAADKIIEPMQQDETKPIAAIIDLDGTLASIGNRSPYSAWNCDIVDSLNEPVANVVKLHYNAGYKIIFCSGRMEKDRAPTVRFIEKHLPKMEYQLFLRKDGDQRQDAIIKEEIFNEHIKNKFWIKFAIDDRISICRLWFNMGIKLFRYGDPDAIF